MNGNYELIGNTLHCTTDGWVSVELTNEQKELFLRGKLNLMELDWE